MSSTVKDLVVASTVEFTERGEHALKGVPGTWRVYAVDLVRSSHSGVDDLVEESDQPNPAGPARCTALRRRSP